MRCGTGTGEEQKNLLGTQQDMSSPVYQSAKLKLEAQREKFKPQKPFEGTSRRWENLQNEGGSVGNILGYLIHFVSNFLLNY